MRDTHSFDFDVTTCANTLIGVYGGWHNTQVSCLHMVTVRDATSTYPLLEKCCAYWTLRGVGTKRFLCGRQYFLLRGSGTFWVLSCVHDLNMKCVLSRIFRTQCMCFVDMIIWQAYRVTRKKAYRGKIKIKWKVIKIETNYIVEKLQKFICNILVYETWRSHDWSSLSLQNCRSS